jgi:hypothetical protein
LQRILQLRAIPILIASDTIEEAAQEIGVSRTTLYSWLEKEEFDQAVKVARRKLLDKSLNKLTNVSMKAVNTLEKLLDAESEAVRRAAANDVLNHSLKYRELSEIEERLESVERLVLERRTYKR